MYDMGFRKAFVFSLDAFIALSLILITIHALLMMISMPKGYYTSFEQAYDLAKDTLRSLGNVNYTAAGGGGYGTMGVCSTDQTYLDCIASLYLDDKKIGTTPWEDSRITTDVMQEHVDPLIPNQFGYRFDFYNMTSKEWSEIYDTKDDNSKDPKRNNETRKLSASAQTLAVGYSVPINIGEDLYGYVCCGGGLNVCNTTISTYDPGEVYMGLIRMTVYI